MPLRLRRDSETSSDSWSIVEDQNGDVLLRGSDDDDDESIYSESEVESNVEEVFDEEDSEGEDEEEQEENDPIVEEPSSDEEVEQQQENEDDYMSSEHSDLEIEETQDEEDEGLSILELREKIETDIEERSNAPVILSISIISMIYSVGVIFLTTPDTIILPTTTNSPINYPSKIIPSFMYTISNITLPMSPIKKPFVLLDGPVPPVSVCMPSKPRNLSVFGGVMVEPNVSPVGARKLPPKSFFSKFKPKYSSKKRGEMQQMPKIPIFTSKRRDLSPIYNLRSSTRTTRKAPRPSSASATLQSRQRNTKNLPSVIYDQNTTLWRVKSKKNRLQKINKKSTSIAEKKSYEIQNSRRVKRQRRVETQMECQEKDYFYPNGQKNKNIIRKGLGYYEPLPCVPPKYKPSKPQQVPKPSFSWKKQAPKPSFDWIQRRAQIRKSLREMF